MPGVVGTCEIRHRHTENSQQQDNRNLRKTAEEARKLFKNEINEVEERKNKR
jgi:hypothetical protein